MTHLHPCNVLTCAPIGVPDDRTAFGTLVVHELTVLSGEASRNEVDETPTPFTCCARCCAPCGVLEKLLDEGRLAEVVSWAPREIAADWRLLNEEWLRGQWGCNSNPPCDDDEDGDVPAQDGIEKEN